ncbi:MAG: YiiD C-terminal domain-containing protein [Gemmatimonadota bacterium]
MSGKDDRPLAARLEAYLHEHIPISSAMGVTVESAALEEVRLAAPLEPNINHRSTIFGGSAAAIAILAGWSLLHVRLGHGGRGSRIVIQRSTIEYTHPIDGDFVAVAIEPEEDAWDRFSRTLDRRGRGRIDLVVEMRRNGEKLGECVGTYVILPVDSAIEGATELELSGQHLR